MSIRNVEVSKIAPRKLSKNSIASSTVPWVRNKAWPTLTEPSSSEQKLVGLYSVFPGDGSGTGGNWFAVTFSGAYTVNFGDGTSVNTNSGSVTYKEYNFSNGSLYDATVTLTDTGDLVTRNSHGYVNGDIVSFYRISSTTGISEGQTYFVINATTNTFQISATSGGSAIALTTNGSASLLPYKIATVTITPQVGQNLTNVNLSTKHNQSSLNAYTTGWLDIALSAPNATSITISTSSGLRHAILERFNLIASGNFTSTSNWFYNCLKLREFIIPFSATASVNNTSSMFFNCYSLTSVPLFNTASVNNTSSMFSSCNSLTTVPLFNTASVTNMSSMFFNCFSLTSVPLFNTALVTSMSSMFSGCYSLTSVPLFNTASVTSMSQMFQNCYSLTSVPLFNTALVTNMTNTFFNCYSLTSVPLFNTASVTSMNSMFNACSSLTSVPLFNTASVTSMNGTFGNCYALTSVPLFNTASVTNMNSMFQSCNSLTSVPLFNTASATTINSMFVNCYALTSVPAYNFNAVSNSSNFTSAFGTCGSLSRIEATGFRFTFSVSFCNLSSTALNEIYTNLPTVTGQTITVTGNYGTAADNPAIATAKGWTVSG